MGFVDKGRLRDLGTIGGLAAAYDDRELARAKIAAEDRAYQRMRERDKEQRTFQAEQSRLSRESTEAHQGRMHGLREREVTAQEAANIAKAKAQRRKTQYSNVTGLINSLGNQFNFKSKYLGDWGTDAD